MVLRLVQLGVISSHPECGVAIKLRQNFDFRPAGSLCSGCVHSPGSVAVGASAPLLCDL